MLPKSIYKKLSPTDKKKVKARIQKVSKSGAYIFDKQSAPYGHYGEKIGKAFGNYVPFGRQIGAYLGHAIGKAMGSGAYYNSKGKFIPSYRGAHKILQTTGGSGAYYDMPKNVATNSTSPPSFGSNRTVVRHREFIGNLQGSTSFEINTFNVNPGDEATFPWLSNIAANYEKYRPIGIIFEFKSTSASALNSTNTALGTVMMCPRYNAVSQSVPQSKMEMLQIENCVSVCPAESAMCGIECAKNYNPLGVLYNRVGGTVPAGSEQLYDFCDFYIATEGMQAVSTIGELWVTYEIELLTPILGGGQVGDDINFANYSISSATTSAYFANASSALNMSNMELTLGTNTITLPSNITTGTYYLALYYIGSSTASVVAPTMACTTNCEVANIFFGGSSNEFSQPSTATTATRCSIDFVFSVTGPSAKLTISGGTLPTSITNSNLVIMQIPQY